MRKSNSSIRLILSCVLTLSLCLSAFAGSLPYRVVVDKEGVEDAIFKQMTEALVSQSQLSQALANTAFKGFDRYIDRRVEKENKKVTLYPQTIFEITKTAGLKGWSGEDIGTLLIHIQKEIDDEGRSATKAKSVVVREISKGKRVREVISALEASESDDDK